jgi:hypothetical protein
MSITMNEGTKEVFSGGVIPVEMQLNAPVADLMKKLVKKVFLCDLKNIFFTRDLHIEHRLFHSSCRCEYGLKISSINTHFHCLNYN